MKLIIRLPGPLIVASFFRKENRFFKSQYKHSNAFSFHTSRFPFCSFCFHPKHLI